MMAAQDKNTESLILETARVVFVEKGFEGARMQEIADKAGINKALLHYYYRGKEKLFEAIFQESIRKIVPRIFEIMGSSAPLAEKIAGFVGSYIDLLADNPHIPSFVLHELYRNPDRIGNTLLMSGIDPRGLLNHLAEQMCNENYTEIEPQQLIVNIIALCVFPFVARPILQTVVFNNEPEKYQQFLESRKKEVTRFILNAIKKS
ncbi:TetR/AcrR family transcriptional regulator [bacterium]|nr:TetR/AcrR family transcriptional regulator [bacterium]MBU1064147.1 TetR/AcrR family transcriptional regulator [bacterium]MBU1635667.1 TetR/AcrR family transcriptional regulator [bacterium]MBU1873819.1 TetR/AcrR family transcriptional regulator [bacterium]